jgi:hypothetical protein
VFGTIDADSYGLAIAGETSQNEPRLPVLPEAIDRSVTDAGDVTDARKQDASGRIGGGDRRARRTRFETSALSRYLELPWSLFPRAVRPNGRLRVMCRAKVPFNVAEVLMLSRWRRSPAGSGEN